MAYNDGRHGNKPAHQYPAGSVERLGARHRDTINAGQKPYQPPPIRVAQKLDTFVENPLPDIDVRGNSQVQQPLPSRRKEGIRKLILIIGGSLVLCVLAYGTNHDVLGKMFGMLFLYGLGMVVFTLAIVSALWIVKRFWWALLIIGAVAAYVLLKEAAGRNDYECADGKRPSYPCCPATAVVAKEPPVPRARKMPSTHNAVFLSLIGAKRKMRSGSLRRILHLLPSCPRLEQTRSHRRQ